MDNQSQSTTTVYLFPQPKRLTMMGGLLRLASPTIIVTSEETELAAEKLRQALRGRGSRASVKAGRTADGGDIVLSVDRSAVPHPEGYHLDVAAHEISVVGHDAAGVFYGAATLRQLLALTDGKPLSLPRLHIEDWPDFPRRGVLLDVSRDKIPTLATLHALIDRLADWKINQLQLYMEHTFAYKGHEIVWRDVDPYTADDVQQLDAYGRARHIELVPSQNSFGHMNRWLIHDKYQHLAECVAGVEHPFSKQREPFGLCPTDPACLEFLADLYDQLLPNFTSRRFNVGLDEAFDLGHGRSAEACRCNGKARVYLDFLQEVHRLVTERDHAMQFWGDIILCEPELIPDLPKDAIALEWGYEADHPFAEDVRHFAEAGLDFYVCPGTSSWNSLAGRTENTLDNLMNAARNGYAAGAEGMLITDWGDHGHPQPLPVSYLGFLAGAGVAWNQRTDLKAVDLPELLDVHVFEDAAGVVGRAAYELGEIYKLPGPRPWNASPLFTLLYFPERPLSHPSLRGMTRAGLAQTLGAIDAAVEPLNQARMRRPDAALIVAEFTWAAEMLRLAAHLGFARLTLDPEAPVRALPAQLRGELATDLRQLIRQHRRQWLARNRRSELEDSVRRMSDLLHHLDGQR
jgi:hypothetical protein